MKFTKKYSDSSNNVPQSRLVSMKSDHTHVSVQPNILKILIQQLMLPHHAFDVLDQAQLKMLGVALAQATPMQKNPMAFAAVLLDMVTSMELVQILTNVPLVLILVTPNLRTAQTLLVLSIVHV